MTKSKDLSDINGKTTFILGEIKRISNLGGNLPFIFKYSEIPIKLIL